MQSVQTNTSTGSALAKTINQADFSKEAIELLDNFIANYKGGKRVSCETLLWNLFGSNHHLISDEIHNIRTILLELLVLMTDESLSGKIKSGLPVGEYLKKMLDLVHWIDNPVALAQIKRAEIDDEGIDEACYEALKESITAD